jgi:hypothetical protein
MQAVSRRSFLSLADLSKREFADLLERTGVLKENILKKASGNLLARQKVNCCSGLVTILGATLCRLGNRLSIVLHFLRPLLEALSSLPNLFTSRCIMEGRVR